MENALAYINAVGAVLAAATTLAPELKALIQEAETVWATGDPTDAQWDALHAAEAANTAALDAPMAGETPPGAGA